MRRVTAWKDTAAIVEKARQKLMAEGKPVFIVGSHYGITSEITFNLPEAKTNVCTQPFVYFYKSGKTYQSVLFLARLRKSQRSECDLRAGTEDEQ